MAQGGLWREDLKPGFRLDRYELLSFLAQGGMASVWCARLTGKHGFEKLVAIKTILPAYADDPHFRAMFLDEARIAANIQHPNVVQILDLGEQEQLLYLVMELVDGQSLRKLDRALKTKGAMFPAGVALALVSNACAGLEAAHALCDAEGHPLDVVHRDISPQNILVTTTGTAKVIDFGIAKARDRIAGDTSAGSMKGKIRYIAPEQLVGGEIDQRADIYSAGAVLYEMLAGRSPYDAPSEVAMMAAIMDEQPIPPLPFHVPAPVARVVERALAREPRDRFATARDMQFAIDAAARETGLTTTAADVQAFVREHLADAIDESKRSIESAIRNAGERRSSPRSSGGISDPDTGSRNGWGVPAGSRPGSEEPTRAEGQSNSAPLAEIRPKRSRGARWVAIVAALVVAAVLGFVFVYTHGAPAPEDRRAVAHDTPPVMSSPPIATLTVDAAASEVVQVAPVTSSSIVAAASSSSAQTAATRAPAHTSSRGSHAPITPPSRGTSTSAPAVDGNLFDSRR